MNYDLFDFSEEAAPPAREPLSEAAYVLRAFAAPYAARLMPAIDEIVAAAPLRHMVTPGGFRMSVALTNCGALGWTSDRRGYRYSSTDPASGQPWPAMPALFLELAQAAAAEAGFAAFTPDACLINRYGAGAKMTLHQDKDEHDFNAPIVSVSLGIPAMFLFGGFARSDKTLKVPLFHGDVVVWGGPDRLRYHGILPIKEERHALTGDSRINFTFRKAG
ncbi:DNA oxidative demethylase AlkB [Janthinobacterium agaricidamnosum]|uniref:Alpha-ketoglutarate-dependent dioxygenase AlkB n=1 Tax=Janthinobacterium agaricidamnosum NBRC 102515 = DSM 9628 TaxID=1349767 RepID=W0VAH9_9BURK|nr:DNA oxidative demethylase AlkB [Janthinobacterium agaricidamnosum]CDG84277.1 alpha-ketoglutarate-dependent dioxygenase AlkB [Janthinobacterium agaricidamnosum NBRC 102515 = DSM 9628]